MVVLHLESWQFCPSIYWCLLHCILILYIYVEQSLMSLVSEAKYNEHAAEVNAIIGEGMDSIFDAENMAVFPGIHPFLWIILQVIFITTMKLINCSLPMVSYIKCHCSQILMSWS